MPSPTSPLDKLRTVTWYLAAASRLGTTTYQATADAMYEVTLDDSITTMQCSKWAKGQRCSSKWITRLNENLHPDVEKTYQIGPQGVPLWQAFELPSEQKNDSLLFLSLTKAQPIPIIQLALAVTGFMHAAELFILNTASASIELSARAFMDMDDEYYTRSAKHNRAEIASIRTASQKLTLAANACQHELPLGLDIPSIAIKHFIFFSKRRHPKNVDAAYVFNFLSIFNNS